MKVKFFMTEKSFNAKFPFIFLDVGEVVYMKKNESYFIFDKNGVELIKFSRPYIIEITTD